MAKRSEQREAVAKGHRVQLPDSVKSAKVDEWPGSTRGRKASPLRTQIMNDLESMDHGSIRRYDISGEAEQKSFLTLFRKCVDEAFVTEAGEPAYGVQSHVQPDYVIVRIWDRVERKRNK